MVSKKFSVNVQLEKYILTQSHFPLTCFLSIFSFPFFLNLPNFCLCAQNQIDYFFCMKDSSRVEACETTPYRYRQIMDFTKSFFKYMLHHYNIKQHKTDSSLVGIFFPTEKEENYNFIKLFAIE